MSTARVLLVDDQPANLLVLAAVLGDLGVTLVQASSGEEALQHGLAGGFAVIVLDVQMPGVDGFEVARRLRADPRSRTTPVIFLTVGETPEFSIERAYALGAVDYLIKPVMPAVMRAKVGFFVGHFQQTRQLQEAERRTAAALLREERELWRTTLASIGDAVLATDHEMRLTFLNGEAERLTRWTAAAAVGRHVDEVFTIVHEQTRAPVACPVRRVIAGGQVVELASGTLLIARDGSERPIDDSAAPIRGDAGQLLGVVLAFRDITDKHAAARRLRESEEHLKSVFDAAAEGLCVTGPDSRCTYMNPAGAALLGYRPDELVGRPLHPVIHHHHADGSPYAAADCAIGRATRAGVRLRVDDEVFWRRDGAPVSVIYTVSPMAPAGAGTVITFSDSSDRKRAEEVLRRAALESAALAETNAKFRTFFEQGTQFAGVMTLDGTVIEANRVSLEASGYTRAQVIGRKFWECGWWNRSPALMAMVEAGAAQAAAGRVFRTETAYHVADGGERLVDLTLAPVTDADGRVLFVAPTGADITERKRAEEALRASEERFRFLDALGEATRAADDAAAIMATTARLLGERLGCTRIAYADVDADCDRFTIRYDWTAPGATSTVGVYSLDLFGPRAAHGLRANSPLIVHDVDAELAPDEGAAMFNAIGIQAIVCCPLVKGGRLVAMMAAHHRVPRVWTAAEVALVEEVVERSWAHIERTRDAAALREKDQRLALLVENIKDYAVIISDLEGTVIEWQGGAQRITGFTPAEAVGRSADLIFTPEDRAAGRPAEEMQKAARDGRAEDRRWHVRKDGARFFADGVMTALYDDAARLRGYGKVFKDATGEQLAAAAQGHHTDQLKRLADASSRLNAVLDLDSVLGLVTEEGRALIGAHQAATTIDADAGPVHAASYSEQLRRGPAVGGAPDRGSMFRTLSVAGRPVRLTQPQLAAHADWPGLRVAAEAHPAMRGLLAAPIVGRSGAALGVVQLSDRDEGEFSEDDEAILVQLAQMAAVAIENTRLYQALRDADRRKDEFLAMLAHELRNPLAPMQNALAVLGRTGARDEGSLRLRGVIGRQVEQLTRLVDDLLDVARITSGKVVLQREPTRLAAVVALAVETSRPLIDARGHRLEVEVDPAPVWLDADPVRLAQVIANLLNNAAKYTDEGGKIRVVARLDGGEAIVRVEDTGIGLGPDMLPRVFDLFTQASAGLARSAGGLGIGLTLVRKLVEMHGGTVRVTSRGLGCGSEFEARLPATVAATTDEPDRPGASGEAPRRVLVVDDNHDVLDTMSMLLELYGHTVATAADGVKAVEVAREFRPEVMFLDLGLPGRDGYAVARILREEFPRGTLWLVALSGYGQAEDRRRTAEAGFDLHLVKPADPEAIRLACLTPLAPR